MLSYCQGRDDAARTCEQFSDALGLDFRQPGAIDFSRATPQQKNFRRQILQSDHSACGGSHRV
jgi:hypothetical protein